MATATFAQARSFLKASQRPDPGRVRDQLEILQTQWAELGPPGFSEAYCWILRKNPEPGEKDLLAGKGKWWNRRLIPFKHNRIQLNLDQEIFNWDSVNKKWIGPKIDKKGKIIVPQSVKRNIMLKPRQAGYTTYFLIMRLLIPTILEPGTTSLLISQNSTYAAMHFSMVKRALRYFAVRDPYDQKANEWSKALHGHVLHEAYSNRHEVIFDQIDSRIICASAEVEEVGQGVTLQHVQCTEVARWEGNPEETMANMKEAIAAEGTLDLESTANGQGGYFFEECMRAMDPKNKLAEFKFHFHEWWWHDEYRRNPKKYRVSEETLTDEERTIIKKAKLDLSQIAFRREKKISLRHNFDEKYPEDPHTCVDGNSVVILANGKKVPIETLVKHKYSGKVLTVGKDGKLTTAKVIGWYRSPRAGRQMYRLTYKHAPEAHKIKTGVTLTEEHQVLTEKGWRRADECNGLSVATGTPAPGPRALQVVLGTLIGDGNISKREPTFLCNQIAVSLIKLKTKVLKDLGAKYKIKPACIGKDGSQRKKVASFRLPSHPYFRWLRTQFYPKGKRTIPDWALNELDDFGIAILFMDDGWSNFKKCKQSSGTRPDGGISLGLLPKKVGDKLASFLTSKGYYCSCKDNGRHRIIKFSCNGWENLITRIGKYFPPSMRYKLPDWADKFEKQWFDTEKAQIFFDTATVKKVHHRTQKGGKYEKGPVYCLDVEGTHNFVTLGGVVHNCFLVSGNTYFDRDILRARYLELRPNDQMLWYKPEAKFKKLQVFERRVKGRNYVIGADPASGKATSSGDPDFSAAVVLDQITGKEMAAYKTRIPPDEFAFDLAELARAYNDAHIAVERTGDGGVVLTTLEVQCQYMNLYKHRDLFKRDRKRVIEMLGFPTTAKTRPLGLGWLKAFLNKFPELIYDVRFLDEAFTFVFNDNGKPEAAEGCHDDTVMCRAIGHYVRMVRNGYYDPITGYAASYKEEPEDNDVEAEYGDLDEEDVAP